MNIVVGKKYEFRTKRADGTKTVTTVLCVGVHHIFYSRDDGAFEASCMIKSFVTNYQEVPPWKPEVGGEAYINNFSAGRGWVKIVAISGEFAWIVPTKYASSGGYVSFLSNLHEKPSHE